MKFIEDKNNLEKLLNTKTLEEFINVRSWISKHIEVKNIDDFILMYSDYCSKTTDFEDVQFCTFETFVDEDDIVKVQFEDLLIWQHLVEIGYNEPLTTSHNMTHNIDFSNDYSMLSDNKNIFEFLHRHVGIEWWQINYMILEMTKEQKYTYLKNISLHRDIFIGLLHNMYNNKPKVHGYSIKIDLVNEFSNILYNHKNDFKHLVEVFVAKSQEEIPHEDLYRISLICGKNLCQNIRPRKFVPILQNSWNDAKRLFDDVSLQNYYKYHFDFSDVNSYEHFEFLKSNMKKFQRYFTLSLSKGDEFPYPELIIEDEAIEMFNNNVEFIKRNGAEYNITNFIDQLLSKRTNDEWKTFRTVTLPESSDIV